MVHNVQWFSRSCIYKKIQCGIPSGSILFVEVKKIIRQRIHYFFKL